jgi:THAP domain
MSCKCSVSGCNKSTSPDKITSYHEFPLNDPEMLKKWILKIDLLETPLEDSKICSLHFDDESFEKDGETWTLRSNSIPLEYKVSKF